MKTLVVYDSVFGNTEKVAVAIGDALGAPARRVGDVKPEHLTGLDALVVGSPTRAFSPTPAVKKWLQGLAAHNLDGVKVAAFDTRADVQEVSSRVLTTFVKVFGYAAEPMAARLVKKGGTEAMASAGFHVNGTEGPLKEGELERAAAWARQKGKAIPLEANNTRRRIGMFLGFTFLFSAIFWALIIRTGQLSAYGQVYALGLMWSPGLAALLTTFIFQRNFRGLGWERGPLRYLLLSYALPIAYAGVIYALTWLLGWGAFTTENAPEGQSWPLLVLSSATLLFLSGGFLPALGEEIGWRGLLVPQLAKLTSFTNVALISGAIWAAWHYPLILLADYHAAAPRWFALLCFSVLVVGISFAFAWLRLKSGSLWTAAILHASHNIFIQSIYDQLTRDTGFTTYITTEFGVGLAATAIIVAVIFWRQRASIRR